MSVLSKSSNKIRSYTMELQLTSMIDMFTILLVFLLKSYSVEYSNILVSRDLRLPVSTETRTPHNILNLIVTHKEILIESDIVTVLHNSNVSRKDMSPDGLLIKPLYSALNEWRISQEESIQEFFKGIIILQADRGLEYDLLHKVIYTAGEAGYPKFKLLVLTEEE